MQAHVLIVDDDFHARWILGTHIRRMGYTVSEAQNAREALEMLSNKDEPSSLPYDLVITDVWMPGMSGLDLLRCVHDTYPELPIAMISAKATLDSSLEAINGGAYAYLTKPFHAEEVQKVVARGMEKVEELRVRQELMQHAQRVETLENQVKRLAEENELVPRNMVTELIVGLRHELGNLATAIKLNLETIKDRRNIPDDLRENLADLQASADDLVSLLMRFKEYPEHGKIAEVIDLRQVVVSVIDVLQNKDVPHKLRIDQAISNENICIYGAVPELSRALLHLMENAMEASGQKGRVLIALHRQIDLAVLTIEDDGPGFEQQMLDQSFSPGFTTKIEEGFVRGLGLGLFITRMVISLHNGQIWLENRAEGGARVRVELPAAQCLEEI